MLAFWVGSVATDARGHADVDVKLPESLTTYRIMAVAGDKASRFGSGRQRGPHQQAADAEGDVPALPRRRRQGVVRRGRHQPAEGAPGSAIVTIKSLDPDVLLLQRRRRADVADWCRRIDRSALRRRRPDDRPRPGADDGQARERDRRIRGRDSGRGAGLAGDRRGLRRDDGQRRHRGGEGSMVPAGVRSRLRRAARRAVVDGDGRARRGRPLSRRVSVRLRRAARLARAGAAAGGRSWRRRSRCPESIPRRCSRPCSRRSRSSRSSSARAAASPTGRAIADSVSPYLTAYLLHVFKTASDLKYTVDAGDARRAATRISRRSSRRSRRPTKAGGPPIPRGRRSR